MGQILHAIAVQVLTLHALTIWSAEAAEALIAATWQGLILAVCFSACIRLLPGLGAARRSLLWMGVFVVVVLLHVSPLAMPEHLAGAAGPGTLRISPAWSLALAGVWGALSACRAWQLISGVSRLRSIAKASTPVTCNAACAALLLSGRRPVQLCLSTDVDRPSVIGFRSPRILLPPAMFAGMPAVDLEQILLHETEHLRRGDDWTNLLQKLALVLFPLNPVLLWIERRLCRERELACDDGVLRRTRARKAYAACLATLAEQTVLRRTAALALGAWEKQSELSLRIYRILRQPETGVSGRQAAVFTSLLALALVGSAAELARSPALVHFTSAASASSEQAAYASLPSAVLGQTGASTGSVMMVKAIMPETRNTSKAMAHTARTLLVRPRHHVPANLSRVKMNRRVVPARSFDQIASARVPSAGPWLLLTSWEQEDQPGSSRPALHADLSPAYAAVPVADGWLIIQL